MIRVLAVAGVLALAAGSVARPAAGPGAGSASVSASVAHLAALPAPVTYAWPVAAPARVLRPFVAPVGRYGPGHRGVDLDAGSSRIVRAAAGGVVSFAGSVAGRGVVVIAHADGIRTEYEPVRPLVRAGEAVRGGQVIAVVAGAHAGCASPTCLHWGARRGEVYLDPLTLLRGLGPVRLLPWTG